MIGMAKFSGAKTRKVPEHLYDIFPVLFEMKHRRGGDLSGGQQQQLAIARALASEPSVLILDEPTEGIQPSIIKDIGKVIRKLADGGEMSIILVEQFYDFAEELADGYTVMARGQVIANGIGSEMPEKGFESWWRSNFPNPLPRERENILIQEIERFFIRRKYYSSVFSFQRK